MNRTQRIRKHGERLLAIFPNATEKNRFRLYEKLRALEEQAHTHAEKICSDERYCSGERDEQFECEVAIMDALNALLNPPPGIRLHFNLDPRGYALKIDDGWLRASGHMLYTDWGGYGILAPDFEDD